MTPHFVRHFNKHVVGGTSRAYNMKQASSAAATHPAVAANPSITRQLRTSSMASNTG